MELNDFLRRVAFKATTTNLTVAQKNNGKVKITAKVAADAKTSTVSPTGRVEFLVDGAPLQDETVGEAIDADRRVGWLRAALTVLSEREMRIVRERRLVDDAETLESLGAKLGISKERVRQIENRALEKLRRALAERHADPHAAMV